MCSWFGKPFQYANKLERNRGSPHKTEAATDLTRWRLTNVDGRQTWRYHEDSDSEVRPQTLLEKHCLGLNTSQLAHDMPKPSTASEAAINAMHFYTKLQAEDGHWAGDYGGPLFLMPGLVIVCYITGTEFTNEQKLEMIRYLRSVHVRMAVGACEWTHLAMGFVHTEGPPTVFGCALNYVVMRLLGVPSHDPELLQARNLLKELGGAAAIPSWGKFWLAVLNVYSWDGMHSLTPELWYLPDWLPIHPSKMWCHCRQVHLGMAYCYGNRLSATEDELIRQLRLELFTDPYELIQWSQQRNNISWADLYTPHSWLLETAYYFIDLYEFYHSSSWRQKSLDLIYDHICFDDDVTHCISIGPISKVIQMLARWHRDGPTHRKFKEHQDRIKDYLWLGKDGMKMSGTNGSQFWDTTFAVQSLLECGAARMEEFTETLKSAHNFLKSTQIPENPPNFEKYYRQMSKGGFPFSTRDCGWIVADCTAEGLKSIMLLQERCEYLKEVGVTNDRLQQAVDVLLSMQNSDGGFASYEDKRGGVMLELLNPSEVFGDIMIDYSYVECTSAVQWRSEGPAGPATAGGPAGLKGPARGPPGSSRRSPLARGPNKLFAGGPENRRYATAAVMQSLKHFHKKFPEYRSKEIKSVLEKGIDYILANQRPDGSWYGSWGVCFTYGAWFGLEALACMGYTYENKVLSNPMVKACQWIVDHQLSDGGWGENFESCERKEYVAAVQSQVVNTAWALLGLMAVRYPDVRVLERGVMLLMERQLSNGDFPQENIPGVFNKSCAIHYESYRSVFPIWALGRFVNLHPDHYLSTRIA